MKKALFPVVAFILGTFGASSVNAAPAPGSKRPGPSAVQAARLKKYPAPSYLSHYLPDDRYKIAGGVWKYVSTDLDTYYHVPSSPNMLRQPANRVIGFANARDAEEAGYVPDPSDGTTSTIKAVGPSLPVKTQKAKRVFLPGGGGSIILPSGWAVLEKNNTRTGGIIHLVYNRNLENTLLFSYTSMPGVDMVSEVSEAAMKKRRQETGGSWPIKAITVGPLSGSIVTLPAVGKGDKETVGISLAKGNTLYMFNSLKSNESLPGFYSIVKSLSLK